MNKKIGYWSGDNIISENQKLTRDGNQSALVFAKISKDWNTLINLFNYWSFNYKKKKISFNLNYIDSNGKVLHDQTIDLLNQSTKTINISKELNSLGVNEFEGSIRFQLKSEDLISEIPIQFSADYTFKNTISSVHGQGSLTNYPYPQRLHIISVKEHDGWKTSFDLKNNYIGNEKLSFNEAKIELFNNLGISKISNVGLPKKASGKRFFVSDIFPDAFNFLDNKSGHLRITTPYKSHRLFYIQENESSKTINVNHGTVEHNFNYPEWKGIPIKDYKEIGCAPRTIAPILIDEEFNSGVNLINTLGPPEGNRTLQIDIFPEKGSKEPIKTHELNLDKFQCRTIMFKDILKEKKFFGHAAIYVPFRSNSVLDYPRQVDAIPFVQRGQDEASTHVGSAAFNISTSNAYFRTGGTRFFARMHNSKKFKTDTILIYPTSGHQSLENGLAESLIIRDDGDILSRKLLIPRNGLIRLKNDDFDEEIKDFLKETSIFTIMIKAPDVKLYGFHLTFSKTSKRGIAMDHFFGG